VSLTSTHCNIHCFIFISKQAVRHRAASLLQEQLRVSLTSTQCDIHSFIFISKPVVRHRLASLLQEQLRDVILSF
jgi:thymidylate synthase ThyX